MVNSEMWKAVYDGEFAMGCENSAGEFDVNALPWNISTPQPEIDAWKGEFRAPLLDAGCGLAVTARTYALEGIVPTVGLDISPTAIAYAQQAVIDEGLVDDVTVAVADITDFSGYDSTFSTIIDSTLYHSLPVESRLPYLRSIHRAAAPGAKFFALVFSTAAPVAGVENGPNAVTDTELRSEVEQIWNVDDISPATIKVRAQSMTNVLGDNATAFPPAEEFIQLPAWLLRAHKTATLV